MFDDEEYYDEFEEQPEDIDPEDIEKGYVNLKDDAEQNNCINNYNGSPYTPDDFRNGFFDEEYEAPLKFKDLIATGKFTSALNLINEKKVSFKPNLYVSSLDELALNASIELQSAGNYEQAFLVMTYFAPKNPLIKNFAKYFAIEMLERLNEAHRDFEKENSFEKIQELTYDLFFLEKEHFPEGLRFDKKGGVSLPAIISSTYLSNALEIYFLQLDSINERIRISIENEEYEKTLKVLKKKKTLDDACSDFYFFNKNPLK
jgi:hypothetical protein